MPVRSLSSSVLTWPEARKVDQAVSSRNDGTSWVELRSARSPWQNSGED